MTTTNAIEADGLVKSFGGVPVLAGVDLAIAKGTIYALLGPNGAGKTTLVRILATLTAADRGTASVAGFDVARDPRQVRRRISLTGQYAAVDDLQTGRENLVMMARLAGRSRRDARHRAGELLDRFDLAGAANRRAGTYSGGMRRRLDLAAGLVGTPEVVFLDEPTTGLDLPSRQAMWEVVSDLAGSSGVTVFLTTQYLEEADQLADRIAVLDAGRIIAAGTAAELKDRVAQQRLELIAADSDAYQQMLWVIGGRKLDAAPDRRLVSLATDGSAGHVRAILDEVDPHRELVARFGVRTASLDDVFLALTGHVPASPSTPSAATADDKELTNV